MLREEVKDLLQNGIYHVQFEKVDGSVRDMHCTLDKKLLPEHEKKEDDKSHRKINENVLPVWDVENQGWRSFRIDSIVFVKEVDIL